MNSRCCHDDDDDDDDADDDDDGEADDDSDTAILVQTWTVALALSRTHTNVASVVQDGRQTYRDVLSLPSGCNTHHYLMPRRFCQHWIATTEAEEAMQPQPLQQGGG